jgi:hypothetical protein
MRKPSITLCVLFFAFMLAVPAFAADVDGKWSGTVDTPGGQFPVNFTFKADGTMLPPQVRGVIPIKDGMIDRSNISFSITLDFRHAVRAVYRARVAR